MTCPACDKFTNSYIYFSQLTSRTFYNKSYLPRWVAPHDAEDSDIETEAHEENSDTNSDLEDIPREKIQNVEPVVTPRKRKGRL